MQQEQYQPFYLKMLTFALIMLFIGPLLGVAHQESSKKLPEVYFEQKEIQSLATKDLSDSQNPYATQLDVIKSKFSKKGLTPQLQQLYQNPEWINQIEPSSDLTTQQKFIKICNTIGIKKINIISPIELETIKEPLARVHGHAVLIGAVIPLLMCFILFLSTHVINGGEITRRSLRFVSNLYIVSSTATLLLMLAKGYSFNIGLRLGYTDWHDLKNLILPTPLIRGIVYGSIHTLTFVSLYVFIYKISQSINSRPGIPEKTIIRKKNIMIKCNGLLWVLVGTTLIYRGFKMFPELGNTAFYIALFLGAILGGAKGFFVLSKTSAKNVKRITEMTKPVTYANTIPFKLIILIPIMITFGVTLRKFAENLPGTYYTVAGVYIGIGFALLSSSIKYWQASFKKK